MKNKSLDFLKRLIETMSPSGYEEEAAAAWLAEAKTFADEARIDVHGNVHAIINKGGSPRVMLAGHLDEIGFLISHIDEKGFLWIQPIGGWDPQISQGQRVIIRGRKGKVKGVIGKAPVHVIPPDQRDKVTKLDSQWVDIGAIHRKEAEKLVGVGDPLVLEHGFERLLGDAVVGRGFDDRVGAFVVLEAGRLLAGMKIEAEVHIVGTVQEEIGLRGAKTSAYGVDPQIGIAVDLYFATDHPTMESAVRKHGTIKIGGGAVLTRGPNIHPKLFELMRSTAEKKKIKSQIQAQGGGTGTDANAIQVNRSGVITGLVSVPNRYMHSSCELCSLKDMEAAFTLIAETVSRIGPATPFGLG